MNNGPPVILASTSPYRRQLLKRLAIPFTVVGPNIDESSLPGESPEALVERLAIAKAAVVATRNPGAVVIGSDQVAVIAGKITGKPGHHAAAVEQLRQASGKAAVTHNFPSPTMSVLAGMAENNLFSKLSRQAPSFYA